MLVISDLRQFRCVTEKFYHLIGSYIKTNKKEFMCHECNISAAAHKRGSAPSSNLVSNWTKRNHLVHASVPLPTSKYLVACLVF